MKLPKNYQIEKAASKDATSYTLANAYLSLTDAAGQASPVMVATDGRMMAIVPVETTPDDTEGPLTPEQCKLARTELLGVEADKTRVTCTDGRTLPRVTAEKAGSYPNWRQVVPQKDRPVKFRVALDPALLLSLAQAIGVTKEDKIVILEFQDEISPIVVKTIKASTARGVLMPVRLS